MIKSTEVIWVAACLLTALFFLALPAYASAQSDSTATTPEMPPLPTASAPT